MSTLLVFREQLQVLYAKYSAYIQKIMQFLLGLLVFGMINNSIGYMKTASSVIVTAGLAAVCAFLPLIIMVMAATALVLLHFYTLSMPIALVTAVVFLLMYIFYFRFSSKLSWLVLVTALAFAFKIPLVIPVAIGLIGTPACLVPAACGTVSYYLIHFVKGSSSSFKGGEMSELINTLITFTKQALSNKEMWVMTAAVIVSALLIYGIRTRSVDHAWKIASVSGVIMAGVIAVVGNVVLNIKISFVPLVVSGIIGIALGLVLEFFFLSVDYTRTEHLEFEDDEYHYYVKAVPKIGVTVPEKSVKHINEKAAEDILLTRSLNKELGLDKVDENRI